MPQISSSIRNAPRLPGVSCAQRRGPPPGPAQPGSPPAGDPGQDKPPPKRGPTPPPVRDPKPQGPPKGDPPPEPPEPGEPPPKIKDPPAPGQPKREIRTAFAALHSAACWSSAPSSHRRARLRMPGGSRSNTSPRYDALGFDQLYGDLTEALAALHPKKRLGIPSLSGIWGSLRRPEPALRYLDRLGGLVLPGPFASTSFSAW